MKKNKVIWLTGLSGAGKSTLAQALKSKIENSFILDGDIIRQGLNSDLGFSESDRGENIRRIAEVAKLFHLAGLTPIVAFISPFEKDRQKAKEIIGEPYFEVHVHADLSVCETRDPKGLYAKVRQGLIKNFTGIDSPYEVPLNPSVRIDTSIMSIDECIEAILKKIA